MPRLSRLSLSAHEHKARSSSQRSPKLVSGNRINHGFTLIELLIVLLIIAVLVALVFPALRFARDRADSVITLSNLRSHVQVFTVYTADYHDSFPHFTEIGALSTTLEGGGLRLEGVSYFDAHQTWHIALADEYYGGNARADSFFPPGFMRRGGPGWPFYTPYHYACTFIASPKYWNEYTREGPNQYYQTRIGSVLYPGAKALIIDSSTFTMEVVSAYNVLEIRLPVAFCDGSARELMAAEHKDGYQKGEGYQFREHGAVHFKDFPPLLHTIDGIRGRDVK